MKNNFSLFAFQSAAIFVFCFTPPGLATEHATNLRGTDETMLDMSPSPTALNDALEFSGSVFLSGAVLFFAGTRLCETSQDEYTFMHNGLPSILLVIGSFAMIVGWIGNTALSGLALYVADEWSLERGLRAPARQ